MSQIRKCSQCGGKVHLSRATFTLISPEGTSYMVEGLGTWRCSNGCPKRKVLVPRYVGCGKEDERGTTSRGHNLFKGMDISDSAFSQVEVLRPIAALPGKPKTASSLATHS